MDNALTSQSASSEPHAAAPPQPRHLTQHEKAAVIVRFLLNEGTDLSLEGLSASQQSALTEQMGRMRYIDRATLHSVLGEFLRELDGIGLSFPGGVEGALSALGDRISPEAAAGLLTRARGEDDGNPWRRIAALPPEKLLPVLEEESAEVGAVVLSKLEVAKAADLLGRLPGPRARRLSHAVSMTRDVAPETVARIGTALCRRLTAEPHKAFAEDPDKRVGAILDISAAATRDDVMAGLEDEDAAFAARVRRAMFTFEDIPTRLAPRDVPGVLRAVDRDVLLTALVAGGARTDPDASATETPTGRAAEFLLANISTRLASQFRDDMAEIDRVRAKDGERAMTAVVGTIRERERAGDLALQSPGEGEEEDAEA